MPSSPPPTTPEVKPGVLTRKQQLGDATNRWLAKNRSLVLRQTPVWAQSMAAIVIALGTVVVVGGFVFKIDEVVTVQGQLQSIGGSVEVKSPAGGKVAEVFFKDGQTVRKGQLLLRFDTRQAADEQRTLKQLIRLEEQGLQSRLGTIESQQDTLVARRRVLEQKQATKATITGELRRLVSQGGFQRLQLLEQEDQAFELKNQLTEVKEQQGQLRLQADQLRLEASKNISQMRNRLNQAELQLQYQNVVAPAAGVIFDPKVRRDGVVPAGETMLTLVPQAGLFAEVFVPNKDIGFVKTGQQAKVRVDAFPYTRYGELQGRVSQIGADALAPNEVQNFYRFPVKLELDRPYLESQGTRIPLRSGMAITTNLKLREKRVISLISDLLVDQTDSVKSLRQQ
jgi:HlyD family secretion protein